MNNKELREKLAEFPDEMPVYFRSKDCDGAPEWREADTVIQGEESVWVGYKNPRAVDGIVRIPFVGIDE